MKIALWILAGVSIIEGGFYFSQAESAIHQILASISILTFAVFLSAGAIMGAIEKLSVGEAHEASDDINVSSLEEVDALIAKGLPAFNCPFCKREMYEYGKCEHCGGMVDKAVLRSFK